METFKLFSSFTPLCSPNIETATKDRTSTNPPKQQISLSSQKLPALAISDWASSVHALTSCISSKDFKLASCVHATVWKSGLLSNVFVCNSLLDMYMKFGYTNDALNLLEKMPHRNVVSWTTVISGYCHNGLPHMGLLLYSEMLNYECPNEFTLASVLRACKQVGDVKLIQVLHGCVVKTGFVSDGFLQNSLIGAYAKAGSLEDAAKVLEKFGGRDVVSWTSVISGAVLHGMAREALLLFFSMQNDGLMASEVTTLSVLRACSCTGEWRVLCWIHGLVTKLGWCEHELVLNSLVEMYLVNGCFEDAMQIFCRFCFSSGSLYLTDETIATLLQGCSRSNSLQTGKQIHCYLIKHGSLPCTVVENSMIGMYGGNSDMSSAFKVFDRMRSRDGISWNTMITQLVNNAHCYEALLLAKDVLSHREGEMVCPDFITMLGSIRACSISALLVPGQVVHGFIIKAGLIGDTFIQNALLDMYGKSGRMDMAKEIFNDIPRKDLSSWNSLIAAYGTNGDGRAALQTFTELEHSNMLQPNAITFTNILSACSHTGFLKEGIKIFSSMVRAHKLQPCMEHCICLVDLLGRSGRLKEAKALVDKMPIKPSKDVLCALLGACVFSGDIDIAEHVARELSLLDPNGKAWRVSLSNVYARAGRWEDAAKVRAAMKREGGMTKEGGLSYVEIGGDLFGFMVNDSTHPDNRSIYFVLDGLERHIKFGCFADELFDCH